MVPIYFLLAMILFDYAYLAVNAYSQTKEKMTDATTINKIIGTVVYIFK
jgi:Zn-dependent protease with chaperone function